MTRNVRSTLATTALLVATSACGPSIRTAVRFTSAPATESELKQSRDGLAVEVTTLDKMPPELVIELPTCTPDGARLVDAEKKPVITPFPLLAPTRGEDFIRLSIVNSTDHVVRLNQSVVKLADPAGNTYELLSKEDAIGLAGTARPCVPQPGSAQLRTLKLLDRNVEIMPASTWRGYAVFGVPADAMRQAGTWKYSFYDMPVKVDDSGRPVRTARFDVRFVVKKLVDTYEVSLLGDEKLLSSKEAD